LDEAKLDEKAGNNQGFFDYRHNFGMTGQNRQNWPDFFCQGTSFCGLGQGHSQGGGLRIPSPSFQNVVSDF